MARILVADDEPDLRDALRRVCEMDGHEVILAADGRETVELARREHPDLLVLDNRMPGQSGLDALARIREFDASVAALLFTAYDDAADVRRAVLDLHAFGYIIKGSGVEGIRQSIHSALRSKGMSPQIEPVRLRAVPEEVGFGGIVGRSTRMQAIYDMVVRIAHSDVTVLVQGESGTGKELVARAIHDTSRRAGKAYVTVDCGTLPETLTESEIFGHEAGAFTDARRSKPGKLELADGGTIFLDEIGNLSHPAQAKLLRVLEDRRVTRLGGQTVKIVDVRIIAATNLDLEAAARDRQFREDLFYRLNVFRIVLPPLRERKEDIPQLVNHFVDRFCAEQRKDLPDGVVPAAMELLLAHDWPGNVRELRNVLERAVLLAGGGVEPGHLPADLGCPGRELPEGSRGRERPGVSAERDRSSGAVSPSAALAGSVGIKAPGTTLSPALAGGESVIVLPLDLEGTPLKEAKRRAADLVERAYILAALRQSGWNKSRAATVLGLNYKTLREKIQELDLDRRRYEP